MSGRLSRHVRVDMLIWTDQTVGQIATVLEDALREAGAGSVLSAITSEVRK